MTEARIKDHTAHLQKLQQEAKSNDFKSGKALIDYLVMYKKAENAEVILSNGIKICENHTSQLNSSK
jgi:hypothetical protein